MSWVYLKTVWSVYFQAEKQLNELKWGEKHKAFWVKMSAMKEVRIIFLCIFLTQI